MCMGKPVWATGISSKRRSTTRVHRLHHGSEEPVFVITNATEKVFIVHSLTRFLFSWSCDSPTQSQVRDPVLVAGQNAHTGSRHYILFPPKVV